MPSKKLLLTKTHDYCAERGPKLTVVMIHGIASDSTTFAHALDFLEGLQSLKSVRFVTFDLLGSGKSLNDDTLNYDYLEQLEALHNSIDELKITTPLILVGHSMGTFIVTRYANTYKDSVHKLILVSAPVYTEQDLANPEFKRAIEAFKDVVSAKDHEVLQTKSFNNSMTNIVLDKDNYKTLANLDVPTVLIYGNGDKFIASYNYPKLLKENAHITAFETEGRHGVSRDKYAKMAEIIEAI